MIDAMKILDAWDDFGEFEKAVEDAMCGMTPEEKRIYNGIVHGNLSDGMKRMLHIPKRPMPKTPFEREVKDPELLHKYRICLAKCWAERDEADTDGTIAGIKAVDMLIEAGLIKMEDLK